MTAALVAGLGVGLGLVLIGAGVRPAPVPLARALAALDQRRPLGLPGRPALPALVRLVGTPLASSGWGERVGTTFAADLRITGTSLAEHLAQRVAFVVVALAWAPVTSALMWAGGVPVGPALPAAGSLALAPAGLLYPGALLRSKAADRRRAFRHALSSFIDVVAISLAGGRGVDTALHDGAASGQGWSFDALRRALLEARLAGETPWAGLARLGDELAVSELRELAASAALAGTEGARVRVSLAAKARAIRLRGLSDIEAAAQSATERMTLPVVLLLVAFIAFLIFPGVIRVLTGI